MLISHMYLQLCVGSNIRIQCTAQESKIVFQMDDRGLRCENRSVRKG